ncbi:peptide-methionine (S)-S-oxide reductase MsrA [Thalassotalea agarivorans]|uniref:Peptide methionine sulfoxide reductase MsrA n=1 Tax=Thalassotalea agarivorans TaxID=349064 RepID=A0A1I0ARP2_THASX|nr:peptide-methionine (S)-S-oxide reductase MsrA [Thalassotalea agarivorans]SES97040.1 peptide-methionine (S)-S-oxide reductase [Thalassotalea agarivorans]
MAKATLAGGCFWCIEAAFNSVKGVNSAVSGYMGGHVENPTYQAVCAGTTGHAEVVVLDYDENELSYREILEIFFSLHNPTQLNRQGNDVGTQYRSAIFFHDQAQQQAAKEIITEIEQEKIWPDPVVTEVTEATTFYSGEAYHQEYFNNNPENQYCQMVVSPKLAKFKQTFANKLK